MINTNMDFLKEKSRKLPLDPGVYIMHDKNNNIIYIGKAKALKNRVSQYFGLGNQHDEKTQKMVSHVQDFEYIITDSEFEALVLECSLIKQHNPKYNILLKDDKGYSYIRIDDGDWPKITKCRQIADDNAKYLGPFTSSFIVKESVDEANKIFKLPVCKKSFPKEIGRSKPCLNFYIEQCCAPCRGKVTHAEYIENFNQALDFLKGGVNQSIETFTKKMSKAAENLEFEKAAKYRDRLKAISKLNQKQKVVDSKIPEQDIIALAKNNTNASVQVFKFKCGRLYDKQNFIIGKSDDITLARTEFIKRYYSEKNDIPSVITLDGAIYDKELIVRWISEMIGKKVKFLIPQKGDQHKLMLMCRNNAAEFLAQYLGKTRYDTTVLEELGQTLGLSSPPFYIEAYDISNTSGSDNVAGMIVFKDGKPFKSAYKKFKIKGFDGQDDYASMKEVIERRFNHYFDKNENDEGFKTLPDLILLDGGKGHVSVIASLLDELDLNIPLFGMVKDNKHKTRAISTIGDEIAINRNRSVFTFISEIQEEVHRYAIDYHHKKRKKATFKSSLQTIPGIGPATAKLLLTYFGTIDRIKQASLEELLMLKGITKPAAKAIFDYFNSK